MTLDAVVRWSADPSNSVTSYNVVFTLNGTAQTPVSVPRTAALDSAGYSLDFANALPSVVLEGGDVVGATVQSADATDSLASPAVPSVPPSVTEPIQPLTGPANVTLALS